MKKRLFISVVLALVLTALASAPVLAAKPEPFEASGEIGSISSGTPHVNVFPAGNSGRWRVIEREIEGVFEGSDIIGAFTMIYRGNFDLETQAGTFHGTVESGSYVLKVNGRIEPLVFAGWYLAPGVHPDYPDGIPYLELTIKGRWLLTEGTKGEGTLDAWLKFIPDKYGHVDDIKESYFDLIGQWQPPNND